MMLIWLQNIWPVAAQGVLVILVIGAVSLMPPANGPILIVSLKGDSRGAIARWAIDRGARLLGPGPWTNSLVVMGNRRALFGGALQERAVLMTGAFTGCGERAEA